MKDGTYIVIQSWMRNQLNLKGNLLNTFAMVYGFSMDGHTEYTGGLSYLQSCIGCSKPTAVKLLSDLVEMGLIIRRDQIVNGVVFPRYKANLTRVQKTLPGVVKKLYRGGKETLPNNILDNTNNINTLYIRDFFSKISQETLNIIQKNAALPAAEFERAVERFLLDREEKGTPYLNENQVLAGLRKWMMSYSTNYHDRKTNRNGRTKRGSTGRPIAAEKTSHAGGFGQL